MEGAGRLHSRKAMSSPSQAGSMVPQCGPAIQEISVDANMLGDYF